MKKILSRLILIPTLGLSTFAFVGLSAYGFVSYNNSLSSLENINSNDLVTNSQFKIDKKNGELLEYIGNERVITIPSKIENIEIKSIGKYAFHNKNITSVTFEEGVLEIKENAFSQNKISRLIFPKSLEIIGSNAFFKNNISVLTFPKDGNLKSIGDYSFYLNILKGTLSIPSSVEKIGVHSFAGENMAYRYTNKIEKLEFGLHSNLKSIGYGAFAYNSLNGELKIPNSVELIDDYAFTFPTEVQQNEEKNKKITSLFFDDNSQLKKIGNYAFANHGITSLIIPKSVETINGSAFISNEINNLTFSSDSKLTTIGINAFFANKLTSLKLPQLLKSVGGSAFSYNKITELWFERNLILIDQDAFGDNNISKVNSAIEGNFVFHYGDQNGNEIKVLEGAFECKDNKLKKVYINDKVNLNNNAFGSNNNNITKITKQKDDYDINGKLKNESENRFSFLMEK